MVKTIVWTKRANTKFNSAIQYLKKEWGEKVAHSFVQRTYKVIELLSEYLQLGTKEHPDKAIHGFPITKHNRIFYRETSNEIILLNFFDSRSKPKWKTEASK